MRPSPYGSRPSEKIPTPATATMSSMISQRFWMENLSSRSSMRMFLDQTSFIAQSHGAVLLLAAPDAQNARKVGNHDDAVAGISGVGSRLDDQH